MKNIYELLRQKELWKAGRGLGLASANQERAYRTLQSEKATRESTEAFEGPCARALQPEAYS